MSKYDTVDMIPHLYRRQTECDQRRTPQYLGAVERLSNTRIPGADELQTLVATERSLSKYTDGHYADTIFVEAHEAPDEEILRMHRVAVQSVSDPHEKILIGLALDLIGRHRKNAQMRRLGASGKSMMSVEEAYAALSAPSDSIDDGLIM
jgi:ubiquitin carboxyl-terminal hydrolase 25/28